MGMDTLLPPPQVQAVIGQWRRFGETGPLYQIQGYAGIRSDGRQIVRIQTLDSGEFADYPLASALEDPVAE